MATRICLLRFLVIAEMAPPERIDNAPDRRQGLRKRKELLLMLVVDEDGHGGRGRV